MYTKNGYVWLLARGEWGGRYVGWGGSLKTLKTHIKKNIFPLFWGGADEGGEEGAMVARGEPWRGERGVKGRHGGCGGSVADTFWKRLYNIER